MERIEAHIVVGIALALTPLPAVGPIPGGGALVGQEASQDTTRAPADVEDDESLYGPSKVLGCDLGFAVLASTVGEPATVRACPRAGKGRDVYFGPTPIVEARHVDSVAVGSDGAGGREVVVRLTETGGRKLSDDRDRGLSNRVGVVVDGEVTAEFVLRATDAPRRIVAASGMGPGRAEAMAARLREMAAGARAWWGERLWRFEWAPRPGGRLDAVFPAGGTDVEKGCAPDDLGCWRDEHRAREVVLDTLRRDPETGAGPAGVLVARTAVRWSPDQQVATLGLDLVFRPSKGESTVLRSLGDRGYGVSFYVPSRRGGWVPIPGTGGWLDADAGPVRGGVRSAEDRLVTLEAPVRGERVTAGGDGPRPVREIRVEPGRYLVTRTGDGAVWLREERPADFELGCRGISDTGAAGAGERPAPELIRVEIPDLYRSRVGTPVLRDSYPRGC